MSALLLLLIGLGITVGIRVLQRVSTASAALAVFVSLAPTLLLLGGLQQILTAHLPTGPLRVLVALLWAGTSSTFGAAVAGRVQERVSLTDAWARIVAVLAVTFAVAWAVARHLLPESSPARRLAWVLSEEDNASFVGIAREVLQEGPVGAEQASNFGAAFMNLPLLVLRLLGGPIAGDDDVRLQAITLFSVSTVVVITLAGVSMAMLSALSVAGAGAPDDGDRTSAASAWIAAPLAALAAAAGFSLLIVLPMRTGFLSFAWGLTLVMLAAAVMAALPQDAKVLARTVAVASVIATGLLLLGSWPFIGVALVPLAMIPLTWIPWGRLKRVLRSRRAVALSVAAAIAAGTAILARAALQDGPLQAVLSRGRDILTMGGSGIYSDATLNRLALVLMLILTLHIALRSPNTRSTVPVLLATVGPVAIAGLLYLGLRVTANLLTDGVLNYSGIKLFYGVVTLAVAIGLPSLVGRSAPDPRIVLPAAALVVIAALSLSPTARLIESWSNRTDLGEPPHAVAVISAIRSSDPGLPIRCLPSPGTGINGQTAWAAYFCARWMEDAFNEGRFDGGRSDLLNAEGESFAEIIDQLEAQHPSEYLFAYRMTMGPGWFGWDGRSG